MPFDNTKERFLYREVLSNHESNPQLRESPDKIREGACQADNEALHGDLEKALQEDPEKVPSQPAETTEGQPDQPESQTKAETPESTPSQPESTEKQPDQKDVSKEAQSSPDKEKSIEDRMEAVKADLDSKVDNKFGKGMLDRAWQEIKDNVELVKAFVENTVETVKAMISGIAESVKNFVMHPIDTLANAGASGWEAAKKAASGAYEAGAFVMGSIIAVGGGIVALGKNIIKGGLKKGVKEAASDLPGKASTRPGEAGFVRAPDRVENHTEKPSLTPDQIQKITDETWKDAFRMYPKQADIYLDNHLKGKGLSEEEIKNTLDKARAEMKKRKEQEPQKKQVEENNTPEVSAESRLREAEVEAADLQRAIKNAEEFGQDTSVLENQLRKTQQVIDNLHVEVTGKERLAHPTLPKKEVLEKKPKKEFSKVQQEQWDDITRGVSSDKNGFEYEVIAKREALQAKNLPPEEVAAWEKKFRASPANPDSGRGLQRNREPEKPETIENTKPKETENIENTKPKKSPDKMNFNEKMDAINDLASKHNSEALRQVIEDLKSPDVNFSRLDGTPLAGKIEKAAYAEKLLNSSPLELEFYSTRPPAAPHMKAQPGKTPQQVFQSEDVIYTKRAHAVEAASKEQLERSGPDGIKDYLNNGAPPNDTYKISNEFQEFVERGNEMKEFSSRFIDDKVMPDLTRRLDSGDIGMEEAIRELHSWQTVGSNAQTSKFLNEGLYKGKDIAGEYRKSAAFVGEHIAPGRPGELVGLLSKRLESGMDELKKLKGKISETEYENKAIKLAAYAQQEFVGIHPMVDGNGRTSRALYNLVARKTLGEESRFSKIPMELKPTGEETMAKALVVENSKYMPRIAVEDSINHIDQVKLPKNSPPYIEEYKARLNRVADNWANNYNTTSFDDIMNDPRSISYAEQVRRLIPDQNPLRQAA